MTQILPVNMSRTVLPNDTQSCNRVTEGKSTTATSCRRRGEKLVCVRRQRLGHSQGIRPATAIVRGGLAEDVARRKGTCSPTNVAQDDCRTTRLALADAPSYSYG